MRGFEVTSNLEEDPDANDQHIAGRGVAMEEYEEMLSDLETRPGAAASGGRSHSPMVRVRSYGSSQR
jgi:hypothetical protein